MNNNSYYVGRGILKYLSILEVRFLLSKVGLEYTIS